MTAFDTNILIYAQIQTDTEKHRKATDVVYEASLLDSCIPMQVLGEFLNACLLKLKAAPADAIEQIAEYGYLFQTPQTNEADLIDAAHLCVSHNLQFFDALIIAVARRAGATVMFSEDMHDGLIIDGLKIVNPFAAANQSLIDDYFDRAV